MIDRVGPRPPSRPHSTIKLPPLRECKLTRATYPYAFFNLEQPHLAWTHNGCWCNDYVSLAYRHQIATIPIHRLEFLTIPRKIMARLLPTRLTPMKRWKVVRSYHGQWRAKYAQAHIDRQETGLQHKHRTVRFFNKSDLEMKKPEKPPRAIQYRHPVFGLEQARYTKVIEKWFYKLRDKFDTLIVGKSDPFTIASELKKKADNFRNPVFLQLDAKKFDTYVDVKWLQLCADFYCALFSPSDKRRIRWLWSRTLVNTGSSRSGLKYTTWGTRMSGDMDTGLGNSLIMWTLLTAYLESNGILKYSIMVNGDDSVIVIERSQLAEARNLSTFTKYGFSMTFEVAYSFSDLEFCQSKPVLTDYGWTMARNPHRVMGRTSWSVNKYGKSKMRSFVHTLGKCERAASWGLPIASTLATKMIEATPGSKMMRLSPWLEDHYNRMQRWWKLGEPTISLETRNNFADAWNISAEEQIRLENSIKIDVLARPTTGQLDAYYELIHTPVDPGQAGA